MHFVSTLAGVAAVTGLAAAASPAISNWSDDEIRSGKAFKDVASRANTDMRENINRRGNSQCNYDNAQVRQEFRSMSNDQRKAFTDAVTCLHHTGPQRFTEDQRGDYPGVFTRYDEYVATHINYTTQIHMTADFLAWHRFFTYSLEQDLRNLCGYQGNMPYWDWAADAGALDKSEMFNGDEFSMGGNGEYIPNRDSVWLGAMNINLNPGTGGGCVKDGPFSDFVTNLGPVSSPYENVKGHFDHNRRCLTRDLNNEISGEYNTYSKATHLILNQRTVKDFQELMQGYSHHNNALGIHGGGHWLGGGPSQLEDFHSSPNDPVFFLHHAMIDRIWVIWQNLDIDQRQNVIDGTSTLANDPPSDPMQLSDTIPFGFVADDQTLGDLMDNFGGPFCYRYE
ncbi:hypothetical protein Q7P37_004125 [Cladosporium fusiforme]